MTSLARAVGTWAEDGHGQCLHAAGVLKPALNLDVAGVPVPNCAWPQASAVYK